MDYYLLTDMTAQIGYELAAAGAETFRIEETMKASRLMMIIRVSTTQRILFSPISSCSIQILSTIPFQRNSKKNTRRHSLNQ